MGNINLLFTQSDVSRRVFYEILSIARNVGDTKPDTFCCVPYFALL